MENVSKLLPLVKDLLAGIYNNASDIHDKKTLQTIPTLTVFLEQVAQGGDKVTFQLTVGQNKVFTGAESLAKPVTEANLNIFSTCCDSTMEGTESDSPILGPAKDQNASITGEETLKPVPNLNIFSTCCESTMEGTETNSPILGPAKRQSLLKLLEPNLLFSSPTQMFGNFGPEISAVFRKEENSIQPSFDSITNASVISSPCFSGLFSQFSVVTSKLLIISVMSTASESPGACASGAIGTSADAFYKQNTKLLNSRLLNAAQLPTVTGARYISNRLRTRSSPRLLPTPLRPNEPSPKLSKRKCLRIAAATVDALDAMSSRHESLHSLDFPGYDGKAKHLSINELTAMRGAGILHLLANDRTGSYKSKLQHILATGVRKKHRNALDLAGKVPFSLMMKQIGVDSQQLWVDSAQAGGLYDTADAFLPRKMAYVEIKGARLKAGTKNQYLMKDIRHVGTDWNFLVFVCRSSPPADWLDPAEYDRCVFWLGVIRREDYMAAVKGTKLENERKISVTVTPGNGTDSGGKPSTSFIGNYISWTRSTDLTPAWFDSVFK